MFNRNHNIETEGKPENDDFCENENDDFETDFDGDIEDTDIDDIPESDETEFLNTSEADYSYNTDCEASQKLSRDFEEDYEEENDTEERIAAAVYDNFPIVSESFKKYEVVENFSNIIYKVYFSNKEAGLQILVWIVRNFQNAICKGDFSTDVIISSMIGRDNDTGNDVILKYIYEHPKFEQVVLGKQFDSSRSGISWYHDEYVYYLYKQHNIKKIMLTYRTLWNNPNLDKKEFPKEKLLEYILLTLQLNGVQYADKQLYDFFKQEIESIGKPLKVNYLMEKLNSEKYGRPLFDKTGNYPENDGETDSDNEETDELSDNEQADDCGKKAENEWTNISWWTQKVFALEGKLNAANQRISLLEQLLGVNNQSELIEKENPQIPTTTPKKESDLFERSLDIAGVQYSNEFAVKNISVGDKVMFLPEPENQYDKYALLVLNACGYKLGYIPRWANRQLLKNIESTGAYGIVNCAEPRKKHIAIDVWIKAEK